jgi:hypothetical protein
MLRAMRDAKHLGRRLDEPAHATPMQLLCNSYATPMQLLCNSYATPMQLLHVTALTAVGGALLMTFAIVSGNGNVSRTPRAAVTTPTISDLVSNPVQRTPGVSLPISPWRPCYCRQDDECAWPQLYCC